MPLVVNVGLNRKASRDYQSAGLSINLSAELDSGLINDPARLQAEVAKVYAQAQAALDSQVQAMTVTGTIVRSGEPGPMSHNGTGHGGGDLSDTQTRSEPPQEGVTVTGAGPSTGGIQHSNSNNRHRHHSGTGVSGQPAVRQTRGGSYGGPVRPATESQLKALKSICRRMGFSTWYEVRAATRTSMGSPQGAGASGM